MKIKFKELFASPEAVYERDKIYDLEKSVASTFVRLDLADEVDQVNEGEPIDIDDADEVGSDESETKPKAAAKSGSKSKKTNG